MNPYTWQIPLVRSVVTSLQKNKLFISGFPTGSGKTVIALAAARELNMKHLIIAPKVSLTQWRRAAESMGCADQLIGIINPERISKPGGCEFYTRERRWVLPPNCAVVWDEPHRSCSGPKSVTTKALAELKAFGASLHAMSATLADSPLKLRALGWWAGLHQWHDPSFYGWCRANGCSLEEMKRYDPRTGMIGTRRVIEFTKNRDEAKAYMEGIRRSFGTRFMSLKPEDIPGFPTEDVGIELIDLSKQEKATIDNAYAEMSERMKSLTASPMAESGRERERVEFVMAEAVAELASNYIDEGNSVVVFFNFTEPRLRFEEAFRKLRPGESLAVVRGAQKDDERQAGIDDFQANRTYCISVMAEAGGAALSLHDELKMRTRVSLILPGWNSSTVKQCLGRIRRCNGTHATQRFIFAAGTVQERVAKTMQRKIDNLDAFNFAEELTDTDLIP